MILEEPNFILLFMLDLKFQFLHSNSKTFILFGIDSKPSFNDLLYKDNILFGESRMLLCCVTMSIDSWPSISFLARSVHNY